MHRASVKLTFWERSVAKTSGPQRCAQAPDFSFWEGGRTPKFTLGGLGVLRRLWAALGRFLRGLARFVGDSFATWRDLGAKFRRQASLHGLRTAPDTENPRFGRLLLQPF